VIAARRSLSASGALLCGLAVALGAYASHGLEGAAAVRAGLAALFAFGHGLALVALPHLLTSRLARLGLAALLVGSLLFCGSLAAAVFLAWPTALAPAGGVLLMSGWLLLAVDAFKR
jgi:uncharacterized membrane protein YgdD (TMEM256/DUF423 family)